jgi:hypothetical protein
MLPGGKLSDLLGRSLRDCQSPLFPKADIQITKIEGRLGPHSAMSGH